MVAGPAAVIVVAAPIRWRVMCGGGGKPVLGWLLLPSPRPLVLLLLPLRLGLMIQGVVYALCYASSLVAYTDCERDRYYIHFVVGCCFVADFARAASRLLNSRR